jgi:enoyl-CoA hydratase
VTVEDVLAGSLEPLVVADRGAIRVIVLNNPAKRNALSVAMRRSLAEELAKASSDEAVRVIVLTGAGGAFCSGLDTSEPRDPDRPIAVRPHPGEAALAVTKPLIAAVDGVCITGGLELALSCSFIIASDRARFADTHAKAGIFPGWGLSALLPRAVGVRRARQLSLSGSFIDAATAENWGIVNEVTAPTDLLSRVFAIAEEIIAADPRSQSAQTELARHTEGLPLDAAIAEEETASARWQADRE